jgi:hypothetical protein
VTEQTTTTGDPTQTTQTTQTTQQQTQQTQQTQQQTATWYSGIDFGDAKEQATAALSSFKTPQELVGALDWRKNVAGGDDAAVKMLERFASPADLGKAYREAVKKISSGELAKPLPKDATPEQVAEWRKGNGIPEKPDGYFEKLPNGLVIGAEDKPMFDAVAAKLHSRNVQPEVIHDLAEWYYGMQDDALAKAQKADQEQSVTATDALRQEWGTDYRANINIANSYLDSLGPELKPLVMDATLPDGTRLFNNTDFMKWFVGQAREINPASHIVPAGSEATINSVSGEIAKIEKVMSTNRAEYNRDTKMQERLRQLYAAREKLQARGQAA